MILENAIRKSESWEYHLDHPNQHIRFEITIKFNQSEVAGEMVNWMDWKAKTLCDGGLPKFAGKTGGNNSGDALTECVLAIRGWNVNNG